MKEWITGRNPVYEVLTARRRQVFRLLLAQGVEEKGRLADIIRLAAARKAQVERVPRQKLDPLGENPQGVALEVSAYSYTGLDDIFLLAQERKEPLFVLLLDLIQNPQNLGTLLRTAEAAGVHGVVIPLARAALVTPAVVSASAGACEHMLVAQVNLAQAIEQLKAAGAWVVGLAGEAPNPVETQNLTSLNNNTDSHPPDEIPLDGPLALVVGNEGEGMRPLVRKACDKLLALPMRGRVESLNAAVAGSIAIYLALAARQKKD